MKEAYIVIGARTEKEVCVHSGHLQRDILPRSRCAPTTKNAEPPKGRLRIAFSPYSEGSGQNEYFNAN